MAKGSWNTTSSQAWNATLTLFLRLTNYGRDLKARSSLKVKKKKQIRFPHIGKRLAGRSRVITNRLLLTRLSMLCWRDKIASCLQWRPGREKPSLHFRLHGDCGKPNAKNAFYIWQIGMCSLTRLKIAPSRQWDRLCTRSRAKPPRAVKCI